MNTNLTDIAANTLEINKSRTLKALFQVICADSEFTLLRKTLELYCEEIGSAQPYLQTVE